MQKQREVSTKAADGREFLQLLSAYGMAALRNARRVVEVAFWALVFIVTMDVLVREGTPVLAVVGALIGAHAGAVVSMLAMGIAFPALFQVFKDADVGS